MGASQIKPEFSANLADKKVKAGEQILLRCEANTDGVLVTWKKDGQKLYCVDGKHTINKTGTTFYLEITDAQEADEGIYTIHLQNKLGSTSCSAMVTVEVKEWRIAKWIQDPMVDTLRAFTIGNSEVTELRFLLFGPVGAGKSSIINTIKTIFEGHQYVNCLAAAESTTSQTLHFDTYSMAKNGSFPFAFSDIMGLEKELQKGVSSNDIISALKGHVKDGYTFNSTIPISDGNQYYLRNPRIKDKMHCLVNVIPADKLTMMEHDFILKMKDVRKAASRMNIPQVVFLTRIDRTCQLTKDNLRNVYKSKKIREKINECSNTLGIPANCIFPVQNYHEETGIKTDINCLMLDALMQIVNWANDYVVRLSDSQAYTQ
ncbi:interferon-induced protein 44-like [Salminus brasiliensis]|uniref:interferon-induced protein 44-like n=1 Tax=Salminus brasiliensis TaxID=930266 RepID=UPI003B83A3D1